MSAINDVTWANALSWRMTRHHLDGSRAASVADVVRRLTTVPAWSGDAELAVGLRMAHAIPGAVATAFEQGELIKTFAFRGATHYFVPEDVGLYLAVRTIGRQWELKSWREFYRLEATDWPVLREAVRDALAEGPLDQSGLASAITATPRFRHLEEALTHKSLTFLKPLAWQGDLSLAPGSEGTVTLQALQRVTGFGGVPTSEEAGPRAILAYLDVYGPATIDNLGYWFGEGLSAGRKNIARWVESLIGTHVVELEIEGTAALCRVDQVEGLRRATASDAIHLIPGLDQWVLGPGTADARVVPPQHRAEATRGANLILVGGRIEGTWKITKNVMVATRFDKKSLPTAEIESEAMRIGAILGRSLEVQV